MGSLDTAVNANQDMKKGLSVLTQDQWLKLSAFTDDAIYFKPSTEKMMRAAINLKDTEKLLPEFEETIKKYARLKQYCQTFETEINPGTRDLANSIIKYVRKTTRTYEFLNAAILASRGPSVNITLPQALENLSQQWQSSHPSQEAKVARGDFVKYIGVLKKDADQRSAAATLLHGKMQDFHRDLKASNAEFVADSKRYERLFGSLNPRVKFLRDSLTALQLELNGYRKQEDDMVITLKTAPLYLLIPMFGPMIMSGVLVGVGTALGVLRNKIYGKLQDAIALNDELGPKEKFMALYQYGQDSTLETANEVKAVLPLVEALKEAWASLTSDLDELSTNLLADANTSSLTGKWDVARLNLETAKDTWQDLKAAAERYLEFQLARVDDVDQAMQGVQAEAVA